MIFDFDKTIIDVDSDNWVVDELGFTDLFNELLPTMPWNSLMDTMMKEMHEQGKTIEDIIRVLKKIPIHPRVVPAIREAHDVLGCELRVLSDANMFFIETILEHLGIKDCFSEINTNPGFVEEGRLRICPYHDFTVSTHGCNLCPPNMCKGMILKRIQASLEGKKRITYLGDGIGDYCPSLKLNEGDYMMPRKDFPAWKLISENPMLIKAKIQEWSDGEELEKVLIETIRTILLEEKESEELLSVNYKLEIISAHETLPKALPVLH